MNIINFNPNKHEGITEKSRLVIFNNNSNKFIVKEIIMPSAEYELDISDLDKNLNYSYWYQVRGIDQKTKEER